MIGALSLLGGLASAACGGDLPPPKDTQAVVWISPLRRTVGSGAQLRVVPTSALRAAARDGALSSGRVLQLLGERRKAKPPRKPWKVTVFQASSGALCRPVDPERAEDASGSAWAGDFLAGLPVCPSPPSRKDSGCGTTLDRARDVGGVEVFRARWRDLAPQGFCVLPLDRFLAEL